MDNLYLPVSLGEAIDKLSILDIKLEFIKDNRKLDVQNEYTLLYEKLKDYVIEYENLYKIMKKVNLMIWNMMDVLRDGNVDDDQYFKTCKKCIEFNDIRFRVKNKINYISKSLLVEQKGYKTNRLVIQVNKEINNTILNIIKYLSFIYDEIIIDSNCNVDDLNMIFNYDKSILFMKYDDSTYKKKILIFININENISIIRIS
jgi:hypothetical protein